MHMRLFIFLGGKEEEKMEKIAFYSTQIIERCIIGAARNFFIALEDNKRQPCMFMRWH